ncbi:unnamed protein product, partial [Iphiclides podalirius]
MGRTAAGPGHDSRHQPGPSPPDYPGRSRSRRTRGKVTVVQTEWPRAARRARSRPERGPLQCETATSTAGARMVARPGQRRRSIHVGTKARQRTTARDPQ